MILVVDVGNTHSVFGLFDAQVKLKQARLGTIKTPTADELKKLVNDLASLWNIDSGSIRKIVVGSVVGEQLRQWNEAFSPSQIYVADFMSSWSFDILMENPKEIGADRLANAEGVLASRPSKNAYIVIDAGTATTFDVVERQSNNRPAYVGGIILPGLGISFEALQKRASKLAAISFYDLISECEDTSPVVARGSRLAVASGLWHGFSAQVSALIEKISVERKWDQSPEVVLTGGFSQYFKHSLTDKYIFDENLTINGLYEVYKRSF